MSKLVVICSTVMVSSMVSSSAIYQIVFWKAVKVCITNHEIHGQFLLTSVETLHQGALGAYPYQGINLVNCATAFDAHPAFANISHSNNFSIDNFVY